MVIYINVVLVRSGSSVLSAESWQCCDCDCDCGRSGSSQQSITIKGLQQNAKHGHKEKSHIAQRTTTGGSKFCA